MRPVFGKGDPASSFRFVGIGPGRAHECRNLDRLLGILPHGSHHLGRRKAGTCEHLVAAGLHVFVNTHVHLHRSHDNLLRIRYSYIV